MLAAQTVDALEARWGQHGMDALEGVTQLFEVVLDRLSAEGPLYNAAKHGLAVVGGHQELELTPQGQAAVLSVAGPTLTFLEHVKPHAGRPAMWQQTVTWLQVDTMASWTWAISQQISMLWGVARLIYLGDPSGKPTFIVPEQISLIRDGAPAATTSTVPGISINEFGQPLIYVGDDPGGNLAVSSRSGRMVGLPPDAGESRLECAPLPLTA
jgi:hypothetical protein